MQAPSGVPPTSPTVSTLHEALLVKWVFASVTADSRSELGPCWHGCEGCSHHLTSGRIRLHEALLVKWVFASVTADSRSELGPCWHGCEGCSHHLTSGRIR